MDNDNTPAKNTEGQVTPQAATTNKPSKKNGFKNGLTIVLVILLVGAAPAAYLLGGNQAKSDTKQKDAEIASLKQKVTDLEKAKAANDLNTNSSQKTTPSSATTIENIKASMISGNTAALEGYMAPTVKVILAASEGIGDRTPKQAVDDLKYLDSATDPWNFNVSDATLTSYRAGGYANYFPDTALVGKSPNDYVVSFTFNNDGKISGIFMAVSSDLH